MRPGRVRRRRARARRGDGGRAAPAGRRGHRRGGVPRVAGRGGIVNGARIGALAVRIVRTFRHDRRTLGLIVIVPLVVMALIGYMVGDTGKEPLRVGVVTPADHARRRGRPRPRVPGPAPAANPGRGDRRARPKRPGRSRTAGSLDGLVLAEPTGVGPTASLGRITVVIAGRRRAGRDARSSLAAAPAAAEVRGARVSPATSPASPSTASRSPRTVRPSTISYAAPAMITVFGFLFTFMITSVSFLRERHPARWNGSSPRRSARARSSRGYMLGFVPFASIQALIVLGVRDAHPARADRGTRLARVRRADPPGRSAS